MWPRMPSGGPWSGVSWADSHSLCHVDFPSDPARGATRKKTSEGAGGSEEGGWRVGGGGMATRGRREAQPCPNIVVRQIIIEQQERIQLDSMGGRREVGGGRVLGGDREMGGGREMGREGDGCGSEMWEGG